MTFIDVNGNYYEGDRQGDDLVVPKRPGPYDKWNGTSWVKDDVAEAKALLPLTDVDIPRALEDLYDILKAANALKDSAIPQAVKDKIANKKALRALATGGLRKWQTF